MSYWPFVFERKNVEAMQLKKSSAVEILEFLNSVQLKDNIYGILLFFFSKFAHVRQLITCRDAI